MNTVPDAGLTEVLAAVLGAHRLTRAEVIAAARAGIARMQHPTKGETKESE